MFVSTPNVPAKVDVYRFGLTPISNLETLANSQ